MRSQKLDLGKLNQTEISEATGISKSQISLILSGGRNPSFPTAVKLARHLGVSLDALASHLENQQTQAAA